MKIEITTGVHSNKKTKGYKFPDGSNTIIKLDGKLIDDLTYFYFEAESGEPVIWQMGLKDKFEPLKKFRWFLKRVWYRVTRL